MQISHLLRQSCKGSSAYNSRANGVPTHGSQLTKAIASIAACGLVFASCGFGAVFAWTSGAEHGYLLAALMVMMAVALELAKPLAVSAAFSAFRSWAIVRGIALSLLAIVAVCYSLAAELQLVAGSRGDLIAKREAAIEQREDRRDNIKTARTELAALAPSRTVVEAQADITKLLAAHPRANNCRNEIMGNATQRRVCPQVAALNGEIGRAERRAELQATISKGTNQKAPAPVVKNADPGAHALATYLGTIGMSVPAGLLSDWLILVPVIALEIGATLALLLVQSVSTGQPVGPVTGQQTGPVVEQKADTRTDAQPAQPDSTQADTKRPANTDDPGPKPGRKRTRAKPQKRTRDTKRRLGNVVDLLKARGGHSTGGQRAMAKQLKLSKSRVNELLRELDDAGTVKLKTTRRGTSVALVA